jgi:hypothetical protein
MTDPYRIPPAVGPATRAEKIRARLSVRFERIKSLFWTVVVGTLGGLTVAGMVHSCVTHVDPTWLIECPGREPWESYRGREHENGTVHAYDAQGRSVKLPADCLVTTVWPDPPVGE